MAKAGGAFVGSYEDPATPPRTGLYRADGGLVRWTEANSRHPSHPCGP